MSGIEIRPLRSREEREACVALQERTWGRGFADRVPASILMVAAETGGVATGAFDAHRLVGFVFGITGIRAGELVHWSDMLAVEPSHRGRGIGYRLKLHQRNELLGRDVRTALWTFDPLEARNAHLNLNRLGAVVRTYARDLYGDSASPLHAGIGTDRLLVEWQLDSERVRLRLPPAGGDDADRPETGRGGAVQGGSTVDELPGLGDAPVLDGWRPGSPHPVPDGRPAAPEGDVVRVAIPRDIQALKRADPELARRWRRTVRVSLESCFEAGYTGVAARRDGAVSCYVLTRSFTR